MFNPGSKLHLFVKALDAAGVTFPTDKQEVIDMLGNAEVQVAENEFVKAADMVKKFPVSEYPTGMAFMCAYYASIAM
jgi:hypothetical protein